MGCSNTILEVHFEEVLVGELSRVFGRTGGCLSEGCRVKS